MSRRLNSASSRLRDQGFALIIAILLLLILTIFSVFATNVGVFEQRTSGNEYRAKAIAQVADAALNHGAESLRTLDKTVGPRTGQAVNAALWELCAGGDTSFPCGAEANVARRAMTYRYIGGVDLNGDGATSLYERRSINFPTIVGEPTRLLVDSVASADPANPFPVDYQVGLLLCRVDATTVAAGGTGCTTALANTSENRAYTLVARAQMTGEQASATFTKTVVPIEDVALNPKVPSVVASGVMRVLGTATAVPNPNSGGFGVPISAWSMEDIGSAHGSWQTCHYDNWLRSNKTILKDGVSVCDDNQCDCTEFISGGGPRADNEGIDILDVDGNVGALKDTREFPCDLMEFLWGPAAKAREDTNGDGWCDTAPEMVTENGIQQSKQAVAFLSNAGFKKLPDCSSLGPSSSGKYWITSACSLPGTEVGSPAHPVQIVVDGTIDMTTKMKVFGIVFGRDPLGKPTQKGGSAVLKSGNGTAEVYGALVIEGGGTFNGNVTVVYDAKTLQSGDQDFNPNVASVPGSWSDRVSY